MTDFNSYDFMITEENEVMLLLYARETPPNNSTIHLNPDEKKIELYRNENDALTLDEVEDDIFNNLQNETSLLICELAPTENDEENEIIYAYEAEITE